jgi:hypothetical protein
MQSVMKGYAVLIGVRQVDPSKYGGWSDLLNHPENDIETIRQILSSTGFLTNKIKANAATGLAVSTAIKDYVDKLNENDILVIYFSGHGSLRDDPASYPDQYPSDPELDGMDDCWLLYDRPFWDDELLQLLPLSKNVRILIISDSCNSGSMLDSPIISLLINKKIHDHKPTHKMEIIDRKVLEDSKYKSKKIPFSYIKQFKQDFKKYTRYYDIDKLKQHDDKHSLQPEIKASVILLASCLEGTDSYEGVTNSYFTQALNRVTIDTHYGINYPVLIDKINDYLRTRSFQKANLSTVGDYANTFRNQEIFKIT